MKHLSGNPERPEQMSHPGSLHCCSLNKCWLQKGLDSDISISPILQKTKDNCDSLKGEKGVEKASNIPKETTKLKKNILDSVGAKL